MALTPVVQPGCSQAPLAVPTTGRDVSGARRLLAEAQESALQGDRSVARATLERAFTRDPLDERIVLEWSRVLEEMPAEGATGAATLDARARLRALSVTCHGLTLNGSARTQEELLSRLRRLLSPSERAAQADADSRFQSALDAARRGQWRIAIAAFADAERLSPSAPEAPFNRAIALIMAGRRRDAVPAFERFLELAPTAPERTLIARNYAAMRRPVYAPRRTLLKGLLPGGGQFATDRPAAGTLVLGAVTGLTVLGVLPQTRERVVAYRDPNGQPVPYRESYTERPYLGPALAAAAVVTIAAAWESFAVAQRSAAPIRIAVVPREGAVLAVELRMRNRR